MNKLNLSLYLVLDPELCGGSLGMIETARAAAQAGVTAVQLRAPHWKKRDYVECGQALRLALAPTQTPLIVNDHVDVALAIDAHGVHVGQQDLPVAACRELLGPNKILGLSISNLDELAHADLTLVDYLGVGPIYATQTKPDAAPALGIEGLVSIRQCCHAPIVAIGGIGLNNIAQVRDTHVEGIAVVSAICGQPDPAQSTKALLCKADHT